MKSIGRKLQSVIAVALAAASLAVAPMADAAKETYTGSGTYWYGEEETAAMAKERAKERAMRNALEQAGVYVRSYTKVVNAKVTNDEIEAITQGVLKIIGQPQFKPGIEGGSYVMNVVLVAEIETDDIDKWFGRSQAEKDTLIVQNKLLRQKTSEQEKLIEDLKKRLADATNETTKETIRAEVKTADNEFLATQRIKDGWSFISKKDYTSALECFNEAIQLDGRNSNAYIGRGAVYHYKQDYDRAIDDYSHAISIDPKNSNAYSNRAITYEYMGKYDKSIADWNKFLQMEPNHFDAYNNRGYVYYSKGDYDRAIEDETKSLSLNPQFAVAYCNRGIAYNAKGDYDRAIADLDKAISIIPQYDFAYYNRGIAYHYKQDYDRAINDYSRAISIEPYSHDYYNRGVIYAYYHRAIIYSHRGEYDKAITDLNQFLQMEPNYFHAYCNRAYAWQIYNLSATVK